MQIIILVKITVVKWILTRYNILNLRCTITLTSFEPTFTLNGIPILLTGWKASCEWTSECLAAVAHLASLGVESVGSGVLGYY